MQEWLGSNLELQPTRIFAMLKITKLSYKTGDKAESVIYKWGKVFKNGASKIYGRQPLKILLGPFWNNLFQMFILRRVNMSLILKAST